LTIKKLPCVAPDGNGPILVGHGGDSYTDFLGNQLPPGSPSQTNDQSISK